MMILSGLGDAQAMAKKHPATFEAPTQREIAAIKPGSVVKICRNEERFWVVVHRVIGNKIVGEVNNHLVHNNDLPVGRVVSFEARHIYAID